MNPATRSKRAPRRSFDEIIASVERRHRAVVMTPGALAGAVTPELDGAVARLRDVRRQMQMYDLTIGGYLRLLIEQGGTCALCPSEGRGRRLAVDHCHATGRVRGLLCDRCNSGLGHFADDVDRMRAAIAYLEGAS